MEANPTNAIESLLQKITISEFEAIEECGESSGLLPLCREFDEYLTSLEDAIKKYQATGEVSQVLLVKDGDNRRDSSKENFASNNAPTSPPRSRPRRNAAKEASKTINQQSTLSLNSKLRRPEGSQEASQNVYIKKEKLSMVNEQGSEPSVEPKFEVLNVKQENADTLMPAPAKPAPRTKRQKKTTSKAPAKSDRGNTVRETSSARDSDVIIHETPVVTVEVTDSDEDGEKVETRSTRTKTRAAKKTSKRDRNFESDDDDSSRQITKKLVVDMQRSDVAGASHAPCNSTYVASENPKSSQAIGDATVVVEKPQMVHLADLMTDDESETEEPVKKPVKKIPVKAGPSTKPIFNPFEQSPVKKKVEAFEKLTEEANTETARMTRTKTRAKAKAHQEQTPDEDSNKTTDTVKERGKPKAHTPVASSRFLQVHCSTTSKALSHGSSTENLLGVGKSASAMKASQAEHREREKRRKEKEEEALKKRDAMIQAHIEEKKKKREEKMLKVQQQKELIEKEKLKALEIQKEKEEKHKRLIQAHEEKKQKLRQEAAEKKLMQAKMKAIEEKKREEEKRLEEKRKVAEVNALLANMDVEVAKIVEKQKQHRQNLPAYMTSKPPLMPTFDCYDSDDDNYGNVQTHMPSWCKSSNIKETLRVMDAAGEAAKNSFFSIKATTPDLVDIFECVDPKHLKRTSSANWSKPPRYTCIPNKMLESFREDDE